MLCEGIEEGREEHQAEIGGKKPLSFPVEGYQASYQFTLAERLHSK